MDCTPLNSLVQSRQVLKPLENRGFFYIYCPIWHFVIWLNSRVMEVCVGVLLATPKIDTPKRSQPPCLNRSRHFLTSKLKTQNHKKKKQNYLTVVDCFFLFHRLNVANTAISHAVMVGKMLIQAKAPLYFQANIEKFL